MKRAVRDANATQRGHRDPSGAALYTARTETELLLSHTFSNSNPNNGSDGSSNRSSSRTMGLSCVLVVLQR